MSLMHYKYVLIGGGMASGAAAVAIRRHDARGSVLVVGQEVHRPYNRPQLSKDYLLAPHARGDFFTLPDTWFAENRVELRTGRRATVLDVGRRVVFLDNGDEIAFDGLLLATGGSPRPLNVPGSELPNLFYLRSLADADRLRNAIAKARVEGRPTNHGRGRATVVGAGLLGVELAATLARRELTVDMVFALQTPWATFADETTGRFLSRYLEARGIHLHSAVTVSRLEGDGRVQRVVLSDKEVIPCDFVVPALGLEPHRELIRGTSIAAEKAILVDEHCQTSVAGIYAAGDCAAVRDPQSNKYRILDHAGPARAMGAVAGANMAGDPVVFDTVSEFSSDVFDLRLRGWGEPRHIQRRIFRGNQNPQSPDFIEFGVGNDGRVSQILAINHSGEDETLREIVKRRLQIENREQTIRDPAVPLGSLLGTSRSLDT